MIDLDDIRRRVKDHMLVRAIDPLPRGHLRLETAFLYPDGASVDVFLVQEEPLLPPRKLSDLGQTMSWLLDVQVKPGMSRKRQQLVEDALRLYNVRQVGGTLEHPLSSLDQLMEAIVHLGQACVRVADLVYTRRGALQPAVFDEIEELLADAELSYEANQELEGRYGTRVRVDFLVHGRQVTSALLAWSSGSASQAHVQANEIFRRWYDLDVPTRSEQRVTVLDDRCDVYREEDVRRLRDVSDIVALSDRQTMHDLLAA